MSNDNENRDNVPRSSGNERVMVGHQAGSVREKEKKEIARRPIDRVLLRVYAR